MANNFSVTRTSQTLVKPSEHTPCHVLDLSVIDRLPVLRCNARTLHIFRHVPQAEAKPADVIQEALSRALVPYYPLAGRLKSPPSGADNDIQLDCSGQGLWFVRAFADCTLDHINSYLLDQEEDTVVSALLPIPVAGDENGEEKNGEPLVQMQVTQFACGGFVIGLIFCHAVCDGLGAAQFLNAVGDKARGLQRLTVEPVWCRDFISPSPSLSPAAPPQLPPPSYELKHANVDISFEQINKLKLGFREESITASSFEIVAASCWMSRARAITMDSSSTAIRGRDYKLVFFANCRELLEPPVPKGFYGNCFFPVTITSSVEFVARASHAQVVRLIQEAKAELPGEFRKFLMRFNGGGGDDVAEEDPFAPPLSYKTLFISEWGRLGFNQVDYGWGPPVHVVPIQGSSIIPVGIVGSLPLPRKGVRVMTWCVHEAHLQPFLQEMTTLTNK